MSALMTIALAASLPYITGTKKECEHFYPNDRQMQMKCTAPIPSVHSALIRMCQGFRDTAKREGFVFVSAKFRHNGVDASCEGFDGSASGRN